MVAITRLYTIEEFWDYITLPEHLDRHFELVGGEIISTTADFYASQVSAEIGYCIKDHIKKHKIKGRVTGADGGYMVSNKPYIPDVAYIAYTDQPVRDQKYGYNLQAPDLAVEVQSPTDRDEALKSKIADYLNAGTLVWWVKPKDKTVIVYAPKQAPQQLHADDVLDGGDVLPEFRVSVKDLFPEE